VFLDSNRNAQPVRAWQENKIAELPLFQGSPAISVDPLLSVPVLRQVWLCLILILLPELYMKRLHSVNGTE